MHGKPSIDELIAKCPTDLKYLGIDHAPKVFGDSVFVNVAFSSSPCQVSEVSGFVVVHHPDSQDSSQFFEAFEGKGDSKG